MARATVSYVLDEIDGRHGVGDLKQGLDRLPGVFSVSVSTQTNCVTVDYDTTGTGQKAIQRQLEKLGYRTLGSTDTGSVNANG